MVNRKNTSQALKKKVQKFEQELEKLLEQKRQLVQKEKELNKSLKETKADYIVALMAESGKTIEELERFAQVGQNNQASHPENGDSAYVPHN